MGNVLLGAVALGILWAVMALGVYITYRILDIADLTVEGTITLGAAVCASLLSRGLNPWLATILAACAGMLAGLCTGLLHTKLRIPPLLSGILTMIALWSINMRVMGKSNISLLRIETVFTPLQELGLSKNMSILIVGLICVIVVCILVYWFFGTELGSSVRATGSNAQMARAQGINTNNMKILGLVISNAMVGLSGALIAQNQSYSDIQMGTGSIVIGLASLIIGEVIFGTRTFKRTLVSVSLGAVVYRIIIALVLQMGMNANDLKLFTAITVAICLSLPLVREKLFRGAAQKKGGNA